MTEVQNANSSYVSVAASQTASNLGTATSPGSWLEGVLVVPGTSAAGIVSIKDGANTAINIFAGGGTTALSDLKPFYINVQAYSTAGAWQLTTGANVTAVAFGKFK